MKSEGTPQNIDQVKASLIQQYLKLLEQGKTLENQAKNGLNNSLREKLTEHQQKVAELNERIKKFDPKIFNELREMTGTHYI